MKTSRISLTIFIQFLTFLISITISHGKPKLAICVLTADNNSTLYGNVTFSQANGSEILRVDYNIQNITGIRAFHIHENGNITGGCLTTGGHYNPTNTTHGAPTDSIKHVGDFGNLEATNTQIKKTDFYNQTSLYWVNSIINRACVIHANPDDLGLGDNANSLLNGNAGTRIGCGILIEINEAIILPASAGTVKFTFFSKLVSFVALFVVILYV